MTKSRFGLCRRDAWEHLNQEYTETDYEEQFTIKTQAYIDKCDRIEKIYRETCPTAPDILYTLLQEQKERLLSAQKEFGVIISPSALKKWK